MVKGADNNQEDELNEAVRLFVDAQLQGENPDLDEFVGNYPGREEEIRKRVENCQQVDFLLDSLGHVETSELEGSTVIDLVGQRLGDFEVTEAIGHGGMGVVFKARDTKLDRDVAVKALPADLLPNSLAQDRFLREAKTLAALNHPNVAAIYEMVEQDDHCYLILEYVPGKTLTEHVAQTRLTTGEVLVIAWQIVEALSAVYEKGIVHRDLKPGNVKITPEGRVKVLDFGLAKSATIERTEADTAITQPGRVLGTPAYMSPEQVRGKPTGHSSDIWSFGCVVYEMLTGRPPFEGETVSDVAARILEREPDWGMLPRHLPEDIRNIIERCLQKDPRQRFQSASDLAYALKEAQTESSLSKEQVAPKQARLRTVAVIAAIIACVGILARLYLRPWMVQEKGLSSIVVLPFEDLSPDKDQEYFCDGMAEELINALSQIRDLRVIARTSAFSFKGKNVTVRDIASQLNVATILAGSVRKGEGKLRVTVQLVDTGTSLSLWSDSWDKQMGDVFAIQDEITLAIVDKLKPKLLGQEKARLARRQTIDTEVYNLRLMGRHYLRSKLVSDPNKASEYYRQALEIDPNCALAYAGLANCYNASRDQGLLSPKEAMQKAREMAEKAVKIDETLPEVHDALATVETWFDWDWEGGGRHYRRAIELNPAFALARQRYAMDLIVRARFDEAIAQMKLAFDSDPLSPDLNASLGFVYTCAGRSDDAMETLKRAVEMDPSRPGGHFFLGHFYLFKSMYEEALDEYGRAMELSEKMSLWPEMFVGITYAKMGRPDEAQEVLAGQLERSKQQYISSFMFSLLHFALGDNDEGFKLLNKAYAERDPTLCWLKTHPLLENIRSDPRYTALLKKMNLDK
ncbi:MAG: protein kinase domain-containing protein [Planctomycetota bacterium]|jgi:serine/threonine-protein kinase